MDKDKKDYKYKYNKYKQKYNTDKKIWKKKYNADDPVKDKYLTSVSSEIDDWIDMLLKVKNTFNGTKIYVKGGAVIGLLVLSLIPKNKQTPETFLKFFKLNLIKDWDFVIIIPKKYDKYTYNPNVSKCKQGLYNKFFELVRRLRGTIKFNSEGSIICIVRHSNKNFVIDSPDVLFESGVFVKDSMYSNIIEVELPLTAMYFEMENELGLINFFNIAFTYCIFTINDLANVESCNLIAQTNICKRITYLFNYVNKLNIQYPECTNGILIIDKYSVCCDKLDEIKSTFDTFGKDNKLNANDEHFVISMFYDIMRLLIRYNKNYTKSEIIKEFLKDYNDTNQDWYIVNYNYYIEICKKFIKYIYKINFEDTYNQVIQSANNSIKKIMDLNKYTNDDIAKYEFSITSSLGNDSDLIDKLGKLFIDLDNYFKLFSVVRARDFITKNLDKSNITEVIAFSRFMLDDFTFQNKLKYQVSIYKITVPFNNLVFYDFMKTLEIDH